MMTVEWISDLLLKHLQGTLTVPEQQQLDEWLQQSAHNRHLFNSLTDEAQLREQILAFQPAFMEQHEQVILEKIQRRRAGNAPAIGAVRRGRLTWIAAAAMLLCMALGAYLWMSRQQHTIAVTPIAKSNDILPGKDGAVLTLADGRQVVLDSLGNGVVASEPGAEVRLSNGQLSYQHVSSEQLAVASYNLLSTPKGRQFQVSLPDGTRVWLNAASSLRYPTVFSGKERRVVVTGEVYFEVAPNSVQPFKVETGNGTEVNVLGTSFNINAYEEEKLVRTTLLNGAVKVMAGQAGLVLKPGQQAQVSTTAGRELKLVSNPNLDQVMAWKNGVFNFEGASFEEVMHQLERWYDIEVEYERQIPAIHFGGKLSRDVSLKGLLKSLEETEVHFRIEGERKLIVLP